MNLSGNLVFWILLVLGVINLGVSFKDFGDPIQQRLLQRGTGLILIILALLILHFD